MKIDILLKELVFKAIRSSGPGGQHVNKTASKVEISFNVLASKALSEAEISLLQEKLGRRISEKGILTVQSSTRRSQHQNKRLGIERLINLLQKNLEVAKPRKKSKPSKNAIQKRLDSKKRQGLKKANRKRPSLD